jgi:hypothetical protein
MVYVEHGYLVSGLYPSSSVQKNKSESVSEGCREQTCFQSNGLLPGGLPSASGYLGCKGILAYCPRPRQQWAGNELHRGYASVCSSFNSTISNRRC